MKRKVIKQGHNTLTITLPAKWCEENHIKAGDDIPLVVERKKLSLVPELKLLDEERSVDMSGADAFTIAKVLIALYETGSNTIRLTYDSETVESWYRGTMPTKATISYFAGRLVGFEIISQTANSVTITNISENITKFDQMLSRSFFILEESLEQLREYLLGNARKGEVIGEEMHDNIAKFASLMMRTLNASNEQQVRLHSLVSIITLMDKMADFLRYMYRNAGKVKAPSEKLLSLHENVLAHLKKYRSFYYDFSFAKIKDIDKVRGRTKGLLDEIKSKDELVIAGYLEAFSECLNGLIRPRVAMHFSSDE